MKKKFLILMTGILILFGLLTGISWWRIKVWKKEQQPAYRIEQALNNTFFQDGLINSSFRQILHPDTQEKVQLLIEGQYEEEKNLSLNAVFYLTDDNTEQAAGYLYLQDTMEIQFIAALDDESLRMKLPGADTRVFRYDYRDTDKGALSDIFYEDEISCFDTCCQNIRYAGKGIALTELTFEPVRPVSINWKDSILACEEYQTTWCGKRIAFDLANERIICVKIIDAADTLQILILPEEDPAVLKMQLIRNEVAICDVEEESTGEGGFRIHIRTEQQEYQLKGSITHEKKGSQDLIRGEECNIKEVSYDEIKEFLAF